jgi:hypothetical protein
MRDKLPFALLAAGSPKAASENELVAPFLRTRSRYQYRADRDFWHAAANAAGRHLYASRNSVSSSTQSRNLLRNPCGMTSRFLGSGAPTAAVWLSCAPGSSAG